MQAYFEKSNYRTMVNSAYSGDYFNFCDENAPVTPENPAKNVTVPFSGSYKSGFVYDEASKKYIKCTDGKPLADYKTGENYGFTNIIVLFDNIPEMPDREHVKADLVSGSGYYVSGGGYAEIKWKKGNAADKIKLYDMDDKDLFINAGKSYVCLTQNSIKSLVIF